MTRPITTDKPSIHKAPVPMRGGPPNGRPRTAAAQPQQPEEEGRAITPMSLVHALRRRWIPAVAVGIPAALLAAVAVWCIIPAPYESYAVVKVNQFGDRLVGGSHGDRETNFLNFRDSQIAYISNRIVLEAALRKPEVTQTETIKAVKFPVEFLAAKLKVETADSDEFVRISLQGDRPRELATIVNAIRDSYMNEVVFAERNKKSARLSLIEDLLAKEDKQLSEKRKHIDELAEGLGTVDIRIANMAILSSQQNLQGLYADRRKVKSDLLEEEALRNARIQNGLPADPLMQTGETNGPRGGGADPRAASAAQRAAFLTRIIAQIEESTVGSAATEKTAKYRAELNQLQGGLGGGAAAGARFSRYESLKRELANIDNEIVACQTRITENGKKTIQLERESSKIEQLEESQDRLQKEVSDLSVEIHAPARVEVVNDANIPEVRSVKTRSRLSAIAAVGMFAVVIAGFTLFEWMAQRISSPSELAAETKLRLLGSLPAPERPGMLGKLGFGDPDLNQWNRVLIESVDVVRTYLLRHMPGDGPQAIVVASASANEGKTTLATQLGSSIARSGRRVCVVDCDFRRPSAHLVFQAEQGMGVSELIRSEADIETITRETSIPGLFFISAGQVSDDSLRILSMDGGQTLIDTLKKHFDFVIIDTSPILFVAEPSMLAQHSDAVVVAVRRDYSRLSFVNQACDTLRNLSAPLVGAVMVGTESTIHRQTYGYQQDIGHAEPQQAQNLHKAVI